MEVNEQLINNLASLAKLDFNEVEIAEVKTDLQKMISFIDKLNEVDTTGVEPLLFMTNEVNVLREDEVKGTIGREKGLQNASMKNDQYFKVPKVINKSR